MSELKFVELINHFGHSTLLDFLSIDLSNLIYLAIFWALIGLIIAIFDRQKRWQVLLSVVIAFVLNYLFTTLFLKGLFYRPRPFLLDPNIFPLGKIVLDSSFPSGHTTAMTLLGTIMANFYPKAWPAATLIVLAVGLSRIHNGMHYPSDVISGIVLGFVYGIFGIIIARKVFEFLLKKKRDSVKMDK